MGHPLFGAALFTMVLGCATGANKEARSAAEAEKAAQERRRCEQLLVALDAEAQPAIRVSVVSRREIAGAIGMEGAAHVLAERVILRALYTSQVSTDPAEVRLVTRSGDAGWPVTLTPMGLDRMRLAQFTGESVPETTTVVTPSSTKSDKPGVVEEAASNVGGAVVGLLRIFTLDLAPPASSVPRPDSSSLDAPSVRVFVPTEEDYARGAPATERLHKLLRRKSALVFQRPRETNVSLRVRLSYKSMRPGETCPLARMVELPLPEGDSIEERIEKRFGDATCSLSSTPPADAADAGGAVTPDSHEAGDESR